MPRSHSRAEHSPPRDSQPSRLEASTPIIHNVSSPDHIGPPSDLGQVCTVTDYLDFSQQEIGISPDLPSGTAGQSLVEDWMQFVNGLSRSPSYPRAFSPSSNPTSRIPLPSRGLSIEHVSDSMSNIESTASYNSLAEGLSVLREYERDGNKAETERLFHEMMLKVIQSIPPNQIYEVLDKVFRGQTRKGEELEGDFEQLCVSRKTRNGIHHTLAVEAYVAYVIILKELLKDDLAKGEKAALHEAKRRLNRIKALLDEVLTAFCDPIISRTLLWRSCDEADQASASQGGVDAPEIGNLFECMAKGCVKQPLLVHALVMTRDYDEFCRSYVTEETIRSVVDMGIAVRCMVRVK
jgi:hypothetical protein